MRKKKQFIGTIIPAQSAIRKTLAERNTDAYLGENGSESLGKKSVASMEKFKEENMVIYNHNGEAKSVTLPNKPISHILVLVMDGDETAVVFFGDLSSVYLDEKPDRKVSQFNTSYIVNKDVLDAWMSYKPVSTENAAFERKRFVESITQGGF